MWDCFIWAIVAIGTMVYGEAGVQIWTNSYSTVHQDCPTPSLWEYSLSSFLVYLLSLVRVHPLWRRPLLCSRWCYLLMIVNIGLVAWGACLIWMKPCSKVPEELRQLSYTCLMINSLLVGVFMVLTFQGYSISQTQRLRTVNGDIVQQMPSLLTYEY